MNRLPKTLFVVLPFVFIACNKDRDAAPRPSPAMPASVVAVPSVAAPAAPSAVTMSAPQVRLPPPDLPPLEKGVIVNMTVENAKVGQRPVIHVETNLPDGTELTIGIAEPDEYGKSYDDQFVVAGGRITSSPLWFDEGIAEGAYLITALMPVPSTQADKVQSVIGANGEKLKGKLVQHGDMGVTVEASTPFVVGDDAKAAADKGRARREEIRKFLLDTLSTMRAIERRSRAATHEFTPECMQRFRAEKDTLAELRTKLEKLALTMPGKAALETAGSYLLSCSDCSDSESSRSQCDDAKKELGTAAGELAKAKVK
ncbi:MAG TPA: hypothetical protein PK156_51420 [Polyangium sp.]|nr:hypothetical protein [Polyangium sp.]